jgi:hypothetical protein
MLPAGCFKFKSIAQIGFSILLSFILPTLSKNKLICPENVGAYVSMEFSSNEQSAPIATEKIEIPQNSTANPAKWAELAVQLQNSTKDFNFFNFHECKTVILAEINFFDILIHS